MGNLKHTLEVPRRLSLIAQTANAVRTGIATKVWVDFLPGERSLSEHLEVSRPTVRAALQVLAKEGVIQIRHGRRNVIRAVHDRVKLSGKVKATVGVVVQVSDAQKAYMTSQRINEVRIRLAAEGYFSEVLYCPNGSNAAQHEKVARFIRHNRIRCCLLLSVSRDLQQWFYSQQIPALVLGSCHPSIKLPSIDIDHRAVGRHAAGIFLQRGHRQIAMVVPDLGIAGDLAGEAGFAEGVATSGYAGAEVSIVRHKGTAASIGAKLDLLFNSARPPTGLFVAIQAHVIIVLLYLLKRGLAVPGAVSLISRDHDHLFETISPAIARYTVGDTYVHRRSRLLQRLVRDGFLPPEPNLIIPRFVPGGTVAERTSGRRLSPASELPRTAPLS